MALEKLTSAALPATAQDAAPKDDPEKVRAAAKQFEALLIGQMLKSMRDSEGGWMGTGEDESGSSAMEYAQESFAQSLAANGGLGLASLVVSVMPRPATAAAIAASFSATPIVPLRHGRLATAFNERPVVVQRTRLILRHSDIRDKQGHGD